MATATKPRRTGRLVARFTLDDKALLERAAAVEGRSVADFVVSHIRTAAEEVVHRHETIRLNKEESRRFAKALLAPPRAPTPRMQKALALYRETVTER